MNDDITVCVATIPPRAKKLRQALASVASQTLLPAAIVVEYDHDHTGAAATKNRALAKVTTEFVCFLDDDDQLLPTHLEALAGCAEREHADVVYSWPQVVGGTHPTPQVFGKPFDPDLLRRLSYIQTTALVRTKMFHASGGFWCPPGTYYDDWGAFLGLLDQGAHFVHLPEVTYIWNHWNVGGTADNPGNTSGQPHRWR